MAPLAKIVKTVDNATVHSFFMPWRRTHKTWPMTGSRTPNWNEVNCDQCLKQRAAHEAATAKKR